MTCEEIVQKTDSTDSLQGLVASLSLALNPDLSLTSSEDTYHG